METLYLLLSWAAGITVGSVITTVIHFLHKPFGILKIDQSDSDKDVYRIEIKDLDILAKKRLVFLKVEKENTPK